MSVVSKLLKDVVMAGGLREEDVVKKIVDINNTNSWGLPLDYNLSLDEVLQVLGWISDVTMQIALTEAITDLFAPAVLGGREDVLEAFTITPINYIDEDYNEVVPVHTSLKPSPDALTTPVSFDVSNANQLDSDPAYDPLGFGTYFSRKYAWYQGLAAAQITENREAKVIMEDGTIHTFDDRSYNSVSMVRRKDSTKGDVLLYLLDNDLNVRFVDLTVDPSVQVALPTYEVWEEPIYSEFNHLRCLACLGNPSHDGGYEVLFGKQIALYEDNPVDTGTYGMIINMRNSAGDDNNTFVPLLADVPLGTEIMRPNDLKNPRLVYENGVIVGMSWLDLNNKFRIALTAGTQALKDLANKYQGMNMEAYNDVLFDQYFVIGYNFTEKRAYEIETTVTGTTLVNAINGTLDHEAGDGMKSPFIYFKPITTSNERTIVYTDGMNRVVAINNDGVKKHLYAGDAENRYGVMIAVGHNDHDANQTMAIGYYDPETTSPIHVMGVQESAGTDVISNYDFDGRTYTQLPPEPVDPTTYSEFVMAESPMAYWKLNGDGTDDSGNGRDLNENGGTPAFSADPLNEEGGLSMDVNAGAAAYTIPQWAGIKSIEGWFRHEAADNANFSTVIALNQSFATDTDEIRLCFTATQSDPSLALRVKTPTEGNVNHPTLTAADFSTATHFVWQYEEGTGTVVYLNGVLIPELTSVDDLFTYIGAGHFIMPGANTWTGLRENGARVNHISVYDSALTTEQITQHYEVGAGIVEVVPTSLEEAILQKEPMGYWTFNGNASDTSGNGLDFEVLGSPSFAGDSLNVEGGASYRANNTLATSTYIRRVQPTGIKSCEFWVKKYTGTSWDALVSFNQRTGTRDNYMSLMHQDSTDNLFSEYGGTSAGGSTDEFSGDTARYNLYTRQAFTDNARYVVFSYNGTDTLVYIDGVEVPELKWVGINALEPTQTTTRYIMPGAYQSTNVNGAGVDISHFAIHDKEMSQEDIDLHYGLGNGSIVTEPYNPLHEPDVTVGYLISNYIRVDNGGLDHAADPSNTDHADHMTNFGETMYEGIGSHYFHNGSSNHDSGQITHTTDTWRYDWIISMAAWNESYFDLEFLDKDDNVLGAIRWVGVKTGTGTMSHGPDLASLTALTGADVSGTPRYTMTQTPTELVFTHTVGNVDPKQPEFNLSLDTTKIVKVRSMTRTNGTVPSGSIGTMFFIEGGGYQKPANGTAPEDYTMPANATTNVALNGTVTPHDGANNVDRPLTRLVDGNTTSDQYTETTTGGACHWLQVDMGEVYAIDTVKVWHYYTDSRTYYGTKAEVSEDGVVWDVVFDSASEGEYVETSGGKEHIFPVKKVRYIRDWIVGGSTSNAGHHWVEVQAFNQFRDKPLSSIPPLIEQQVHDGLTNIMLASDPMALWPLNGSYKDISVYRRHLKVRGTPEMTSANEPLNVSKTGTYWPSGANKYAYLSKQPTGIKAIEGWAKIRVKAEYTTIFGVNQPTSGFDDRLMLLNTPDDWMEVHSNVSGISHIRSATTDADHFDTPRHVLWQYEEGVGTVVYIDGVKIDDLTYATGNLFENDSNQLIIGNYLYDNSSGTYGFEMSHVAIYAQPLTQKEIDLRLMFRNGQYAGIKHVCEQLPLAYWPFVADTKDYFGTYDLTDTGTPTFGPTQLSKSSVGGMEIAGADSPADYTTGTQPENIVAMEFWAQFFDRDGVDTLIALNVPDSGATGRFALQAMATHEFQIDHNGTIYSSNLQDVDFNNAGRHVVIQYESGVGETRTYVNGVQIADLAITGNVFATGKINPAVLVEDGVANGGGARIGQLAVYDKELSQWDIERRFFTEYMSSVAVGGGDHGPFRWTNWQQLHTGNGWAEEPVGGQGEYGSNTPDQGYLFAAMTHSVRTDSPYDYFDKTKTGHADWETNHGETADHSLTHVAQGSGTRDTGTQTPNHIIPFFNKDWTLYFAAFRSCWAGDVCDSQIEFLDSNNQTLIAMRTGYYNSYGSYFDYGRTLSGMSRASMSGSWPNTGGQITFTDDSVTFTNTRGSNWNGSWTISGVDVASITQIRIKSYRAYSSYTGGNGCGAGVYLRILPPA